MIFVSISTALLLLFFLWKALFNKKSIGERVIEAIFAVIGAWFFGNLSGYMLAAATGNVVESDTVVADKEQLYPIPSLSTASHPVFLARDSSWFGEGWHYAVRSNDEIREMLVPDFNISEAIVYEEDRTDGERIRYSCVTNFPEYDSLWAQLTDTKVYVGRVGSCPEMNPVYFYIPRGTRKEG